MKLLVLIIWWSTVTFAEATCVNVFECHGRLVVPQFSHAEQMVAFVVKSLENLRSRYNQSNENEVGDIKRELSFLVDITVSFKVVPLIRLDNISEFGRPYPRENRKIARHYSQLVEAHRQMAEDLQQGFRFFWDENFKEAGKALEHVVGVAFFGTSRGGGDQKILGFLREEAKRWRQSKREPWVIDNPYRVQHTRN